MNLSVFEIGMLACFGVAWPVSIYKSIKARSAEGKSLLFMIVVFAGYVSGTLHKAYYYYDAVIYLYIFNGVMIFVDILLYFKYKKLDALQREDAQPRSNAESGGFRISAEGLSSRRQDGP